MLLDGDNQVKLTDFGLAIMHEQYMQFSETDPGGGTMRWMVRYRFTHLLYGVDLLVVGARTVHGKRG